MHSDRKMMALRKSDPAFDAELIELERKLALG
jgi:hypothetical protein